MTDRETTGVSPFGLCAKTGSGRNDTIAVVLVNFNSGTQLGKAIDSLGRQKRPPDEIVVVDNGSTDGSLGLVEWPGTIPVRLLCLQDNLGFAAATNLGVRAASSEWIAMLNCDAEAEPAWLESLRKAALRHPDCSVFTSAQSCLDTPYALDGAGDVVSVTGLAWRGDYGADSSSLPVEGSCFGMCAAGSFVSRALFLQLDGFEESYFCYLEDVDFSYRLRLAGQDCVFVPSARIWHRGGGTSGRRSAFTIQASARNRIRLFVRTTPLAMLLLTWPLFLVGLGVTLAQGLRHGQGGAVLRGLWEALLGLPESLRQRARVAPPVLPPRALWQFMAWNPFAPLTRRSRIRPKPPVVHVDRTASGVPGNWPMSFD